MKGFRSGRIDERAVVGERAVLGERVTVVAFAVACGGVTHGGGAFVGPHSIPGWPAGNCYERGDKALGGCNIGAGSGR